MSNTAGGVISRHVAIASAVLSIGLAGLGHAMAQGSVNSQAGMPPFVAQPPAVVNPMQGDLGRPYNLPPASRARIHHCAIEWQKMKLSGAATDMIWRVFATGCFTAEDAKTTDVSEPKQNR